MTCHYCGMPATGKVVHAKTGNAVAHFECWYDGSAFHPQDRDRTTGELPPPQFTDMDGPRWDGL